MQSIREGFRVLRAHQIPITPAINRVLGWLPEALLLFIMKKMLGDEEVAIKIGHAKQARPEMLLLVSELRELIKTSGIPTPAFDTLAEDLGATQAWAA